VVGLSGELQDVENQLAKHLSGYNDTVLHEKASSGLPAFRVNGRLRGIEMKEHRRFYPTCPGWLPKSRFDPVWPDPDIDPIGLPGSEKPRFGGGRDG